MVKFIIAKQLMGKKVLSLSGYDIGRFVDAQLSSVTGKINYLMLEPDPESMLAKKLSPEGSELKVPYSSIVSVADYIMVDTKNM